MRRAVISISSTVTTAQLCAPGKHQQTDAMTGGVTQYTRDGWGQTPALRTEANAKPRQCERWHRQGRAQGARALLEL